MHTRKFLFAALIASFGTAANVTEVNAQPPVVTIPAATPATVTIGSTGQTVEQPDVKVFRVLRLLDQFSKLIEPKIK